MAKTINYNIVEYVREYYSYEYNEEQFKMDCETCGIEGITFDELCDIMDENVDDKEILRNPRFWEKSIREDGKVVEYAREFFEDLMRQGALDEGCDDTECDDTDWDVEIDDDDDDNDELEDEEPEEE